MTTADDGRTLVVGPRWVGDMVMAQSLFKVLKAEAPARGLDVLAPPWALPLLGYMPEVDQAIPLPVGQGELALGRRLTVARDLRGRGYDRAIVLSRSFKAALVPFLARIPHRIGVVGEGRWGLLNDRRRLDPGLVRTVDRFAALGRPAGRPPAETPLPALVVPPAAVDEALAAMGLARPARPLLALCPGAEYGPAKRWPAAHFADLARSALAGGWIVWLFGSAKERDLTAEIDRLAGTGCVDLAGRSRLEQSVALLSLADAVVSNDSGLMHVAAALGLRQVALYGSSSPHINPPLSPRAAVLSLGLECSPCRKRVCPLGHHRCLRDLSPDAVRQALAAA